MNKSAHPVEVVRIYEQGLKESPAEGRYIEIGRGHKIHLLEAGNGPPVVMLHGTGGVAYEFLPLLERLQGVRAIAPDRPGSGLSDPFTVTHKSYRDWAIEVLDKILNILKVARGVDQITLAGASGGGLWAIWYSLANPERVQRLIFLTGIPLLPGTRTPLPLRLTAVPIIGALIARIPANEKMVMNLMGIMGEKETIVNYPRMIEVLVATNNDPVASNTARTEFSAMMNFLGFRKSMKIQAEELAQLTMPTLMIWGKRDPLGGEDVARAVSQAIPNCVLEVLPAGHSPWLGYPDKTAELIQDFVLSK